MTITKSLVATAVSGMVLGALTVGCGSSNAAAPGAKMPDAPSQAKACCKGMNECKGKGGCKANGSCAGKNECKGKGGCNGNCPKT